MSRQDRAMHPKRHARFNLWDHRSPAKLQGGGISNRFFSNGIAGRAVEWCNALRLLHPTKVHSPRSASVGRNNRRALRRMSRQDRAMQPERHVLFNPWDHRSPAKLQGGGISNRFFSNGIAARAVDWCNALRLLHPTRGRLVGHPRRTQQPQGIAPCHSRPFKASASALPAQSCG